MTMRKITELRGVSVEDAVQLTPERVAFELSNGRRTTPVELPPGPRGLPGRDGANVLPTDTAIAEALTTPSSLSGVALAGEIRQRAGSNLGRFISRCRAGEPVKVVAIGDSILEGTTVTADGGVLGVDDTLSRVATLGAERFGTTVTTANHAKSGHTVAIGPLSAKWDDAVNEQGDLYLIDYLTNDLSAELTDVPVPGYPLDAFLAGVERLFRRLRRDVPKADVAFLIANPYRGGDGQGNNVMKAVYAKRVQDVCAAYGVELIDGYTPFIEYGDYEPLMADTTHPNSAGHAVLAETIMRHLPASQYGMGHVPGVVPAKGVHRPELVDESAGDTGTQYVLAPTAPMWVESGTWATNGGYRETSAIGSAITGSGNFTELYAMIDTTTTKGLRASLSIDGQAVYVDVPFTTGKQGPYWVPLVTGLEPGGHEYRFELTGGAMQIRRIGWLAGAQTTESIFVNPYVQQKTLQPFTTGTLDVPTDGATLYLYGDLHGGAGVQRIDRPEGWGAMSVSFQGQVDMRILGPTTTPRQVYVTIRHNGAIIYSQYAEIPATSTHLRSPWFSFTTPPVIQDTDQRTVSMEARASSADKTGVQVLAYSLGATMIRTG